MFCVVCFSSLFLGYNHRFSAGCGFKLLRRGFPVSNAAAKKMCPGKSACEASMLMHRPHPTPQGLPSPCKTGKVAFRSCRMSPRPRKRGLCSSPSHKHPWSKPCPRVLRRDRQKFREMSGTDRMETEGEKSLHYIKEKPEPLVLRQQLHPIKIRIKAQIKQNRDVMS